MRIFMQGKLLIAFFAALFLFGTLGATYVYVEAPVTGMLYNNSSILLGKVGPGETFYVSASANTTNASGVFVNKGWSKFEAVTLPPGWSAQTTPLYENPMKLKIAVSPLAQNGTYELVLRAVNVYGTSIKNVTFDALINVTPNVFNLQVTPIYVKSGVGQPVNLYVTINNTGTSDDPFIINAYGLPGWNVSDEVISPHLSANKFVYPVFMDEPGLYSFNVTVSSATSPLISKSYRVKLLVEESLLNDYSATGEGVILSPIIYEPSYAFMLFVDWLYKVAK